MKLAFLLFFLFLPAFLKASDPQIIKVIKGETTFTRQNNITILEDKTNQLSFQQVKSAQFKINTQEVPNFDLSESTFWIRLKIKNKTSSNKLLLHISYPTIDSVTLFYPTSSQDYQKILSGERMPIDQRQFKSQEILFQFPIHPDSTDLIYLKIRSMGSKLIPITVGTTQSILRDISLNDKIFGVYLGIIGIMLLYNLFIYISIRDIDYLLYVFYILTIGLTQIVLKGYGYYYIWQNSLFFIKQGINLSGALSGIGTCVFTLSFLKTKSTFPFFDKFIKGILILYLFGVFLSITGFVFYSYQIINLTALVGSIVAIACSIILAFRGYRTALFYSVALSFFLLSVALYVLVTSNFIPYNIFTKNILLIGSAIEVALLSFALADKINEYRNEKDRAHLAVLQAVREKEKYVRQENVVLEARVKQRTADLEDSNNRLQKTNSNLNIALENLKKAETQLVHAEKMASLGQLTAGIAHEINNPINFVKSNIQPLKRDLADLSELILKYKEINKDNLEEKQNEIRAFIKEIDLEILEEEVPTLISGIEEGADRTIEIVRGLREFSRSDENVIKKTDIHVGIESTLRLLKKIIPNNIVIKKEYGKLPLIEGYPGQLNQVFVNLLTNAAQAIENMPNQEDSYITILTKSQNEEICIQITDTGSGIPEEVKNKIFDPFFTTKDVGKGTGLGLSIVYSIIQRHNGKIEVVSEIGKGATFTITLPVEQPFSEESED